MFHVDPLFVIHLMALLLLIITWEIIGSSCTCLTIITIQYKGAKIVLLDEMSNHRSPIEQAVNIHKRIHNQVIKCWGWESGLFRWFLWVTYNGEWVSVKFKQISQWIDTAWEGKKEETAGVGWMKKDERSARL